MDVPEDLFYFGRFTSSLTRWAMILTRYQSMRSWLETLPLSLLCGRRTPMGSIIFLSFSFRRKSPGIEALFQIETSVEY